MKSYKEINEQIPIDELMKSHVKSKMTTRSHGASYHKKLCAACLCCLLVAVGVYYRNMSHDGIVIENITKEIAKQNQQQDNQNIMNYDKQTKTGSVETNLYGFTMNLIAMDQKEKAEYEQQFPELENLCIPEKLTNQKISYHKYEQDDNSYPYIVYTLQGQNTQEDAKIEVTIQDEHIPGALQADMRAYPTYHGFQLRAYKIENTSTYGAKAYQAPYVYEVICDGITSSEFTDFTESFFSK